MMMTIKKDTHCFCLKLRRSAEHVVRFYDTTLAPAGVTVRQYSLLKEVNAHQGCTVSELASVMCLDRSTLARSIKPLLKAGFLIDEKESGARNSKLQLTESGVAAYHHAFKLWQEAQERFYDVLGEESMENLETDLTKLMKL
jgi:DNA-binding MarR family transcriptional regulator